MARTRSRQPQGTPSGGQFATQARSETDVQLHAPADPATEVSVPNPDDPFEMPIYEGPASGAASRLVPGSYTAYGLADETPYLLTVPDPGAIDWQGELTVPPGIRTAVVDGHRVTMAMARRGDDPEDATLPREVSADGRDAGRVAFSFDDAAWRASTPDGTATVEDTEDAAVRALVLKVRGARAGR